MVKKNKTNKDLKKSEEKFRSLVEATSDFVWEVNKNGKFTYASPKIKKILGYKPEEILGKTPFSLMPANEAKKLKKFFNKKKASSAPFAELENVNIHKDGHAVTLETSAVPFFDENKKLLGYRGIDRDISKRKKIEKFLKKSEKKYRNLAEKNYAAIIIINLKKRITYANNSFFKLSGYNKNDLNKLNLLALIHPDDQKLALNRFAKRLSEKKIQTTFECKILTKSKKIIYVNVSSSPIKEGKKIIGVHAVIRDITERKLARFALEESEKKYKDLIHNASVGVIIFNKKGFISYANKSFSKITRYPNKHIVNKNILSIIHPSKKENDKKRLKERMSGKHLSLIYNTKILTKKGDVKYLSFATSLIKKDGEIKGAQAMIRDVTHEMISAKENKNTLIYEKLVSDASYRSLVIKNFDNFLNTTLKDLGLKMDVCRAYVFKIDPVLDVTSNTHEWCNKKIPSKIKSLQNIPLNFYSSWMKALYSDKIIKIKNTSTIKNKIIKTTMLRQGIKSVLLIPIITPKGLYGFIGFDKCDKYIDWSGQQIKILRIISNIISQTINNKFLQKEIYNLKEHYKQIVDTIQDGIFVINRNFKIISCNKAFAKKTNLPIRKIIGSSCSAITSIYDNHLLKNHCKNHLENNSPNSHGCAIAKVFTSKKTISFVEKNYDSNKKAHYHRINVFPAIDKKGNVYQIVTTIKNISKKMRVEEEFRKLSEFNQKILDNIPVSIIAIDKKGIVTSVNKFFFKLTNNKKFIGKSIYNAPFFKREKLTDKYTELLKSGKPFFRSNCKATDAMNEVRYLNIVATPLKNKAGNIMGAISMAMDNTESVLRKKEIEKLNDNLEKKIIKRTWQLNKVNQRLYNTLDLKSKFIADASHELRTPLTIMQGNLDLMSREFNKNNPEINENIEYMKKEVKLMSRILSDLTLLTSEKTDSIELDYEEINISNLISTICRSLKVLADKKGIKIKHNNISNIKIMGDETNLEKLFLNILRNAIKYGKKNGLIDIKLKKLPEKIVISISDNGIGISTKDLPNIFERFYRVSKSRSRKEGGTGLGLAIAKWITEAHGGFIEVGSKLNKGSIFSIHLPCNYKANILKRALL